MSHIPALHFQGKAQFAFLTISCQEVGSVFTVVQMIHFSKITFITYRSNWLSNSALESNTEKQSAFKTAILQHDSGDD